jgi:hypothetical protein
MHIGIRLENATRCDCQFAEGGPPGWHALSGVVANVERVAVRCGIGLHCSISSGADYARLGQDADGWKRSQIVIAGVTYRRVQGGDAGLGHGATRDLYGTFREGRCYLFEGGIHTTTADNPKFLAGAKLRKIENQIAAVMQSVKIQRSPR